MGGCLWIMGTWSNAGPAVATKPPSRRNTSTPSHRSQDRGPIDLSTIQFPIHRTPFFDDIWALSQTMNEFGREEGYQKPVRTAAGTSTLAGWKTTIFGPGDALPARYVEVRLDLPWRERCFQMRQETCVQLPKPAQHEFPVVFRNHQPPSACVNIEIVGTQLRYTPQEDARRSLPPHGEDRPRETHFAHADHPAVACFNRVDVITNENIGTVSYFSGLQWWLRSVSQSPAGNSFSKSTLVSVPRFDG